ncbi:MAG: hypothetical protein HQM04_18825, partial [Magnetococcales bacterium]|nr:hypothetical protein [Magnetococcales bacterium]MBF0117085.1 hypothetical protein [Magnetococcales bacterium]
MQIGTQIIRYMASHFREIELRFKILGWIDKAITNSDLTIDQFFRILSVKLAGIAPGMRIDWFVVVDGEALPFPTEEGKSDVILPKRVLAAMLPKESPPLRVFPDKQIGGGRLVFRLDIDGAPTILMVLQEQWVEPLEPRLREDDLQHFLTMVCEQTEIFVSANLKLAFDIGHTKLVKSFFTGNIDHIHCWQDLAKLVADFLPNWEPLKITPPPLVQILTYRKKEAQYIELRASYSGNNDESRGSRDEARNLLRNQTVCGLFLDMHENNPQMSHLLVNPKDAKYSSRYAAYFDREQLPQSELVVPILYQERDGTYSLIGLINFEHSREKAFNTYHLRIIQKTAASLAPFIQAMMADENARIMRASTMRYALLRVQHRMSALLKHKISQPIFTATQIGDLIRKSLALPEINKENLLNASSVLDHIVTHISNIHLFLALYGQSKVMDPL